MYPGSEKVKLVTPVNERDHSQGPNSAPVTLVEYGDYECPHCDQANLIVKELRRRFGDDVRFVFRHFPLVSIHPHAQRAAEAAEAAAAQNRFWEMHECLFKNQHALDDEHLQMYATKIGLDTARFNREMKENLYAELVREDVHSGLYGGRVTGTPTFYINGVRHDDTPDLERMLAAIKRVLEVDRS